MYKALEIVGPEVNGSKKIPIQNCLVCGEIMGAMPGGRDAVCKNCGYKDPCCE